MDNQTQANASIRAPDPFPSVLHVGEAASFLRVDPKTVRAMLRCGRLKGGRVGRVWRIAGSSVLALIGAAPCPSPLGLPERVPESRRPGRPRKIRRRSAAVVPTTTGEA
jgi:excisionase family DNA binding protein